LPADEWQVVQFLADIQAGRYVDFEEIGDTYLDQRVAEAMAREGEVGEHSPAPPEKKQKLRLPSADDIRRARDLLRKTTGREANVVEIVGSNDGTATFRVGTRDGTAAQNTPGMGSHRPIRSQDHPKLI
ncbi:MAG: hypothetical protein WBW73_01530, partial [Rhodoplanes sp.]